MKINSTFAKTALAATFGLILISSSIKVAAQDFEIVSFSECFSDNGTYSHADLLPKEVRLNKHSSKIKIGQNELPDSIYKCVLFAKDIWEATINSNLILNVDVLYEPIKNDIETDVLYFNTSTESIPNSLYKHITSSATELADGTIRINSDTNWDCSVGNDSNSNLPNLTFALLRSFAKILGFGSIIRVDDNKMLYCDLTQFYSTFDKNIKSSDDIAICDIDLNQSQQLTDFFNLESRQFYFAENNAQYELEKAPAHDGTVLTYLKNGNNSLMSFNPKRSSSFLRVDTLTQNILNKLGWNINRKPEVEIVCNDAGNNGIMSAYSEHTFYIKSKYYNGIEEPRWQLSLPLPNGEEEILTLNDNGLSCTIPVIGDDNKYAYNLNGDIYANLSFSCMINGELFNAEPYRISLELKPHIEYINITNIVQHPEQQTYDVYFEIKYYGANQIDIDIEEEYGSWLKSKSIKEPYWTKGKCEQITAPYYSWIDFTVKNTYGSVVKTLELAPYGDIINSNDDFANIEDNNIELEQIEYIEIYNFLGVFYGKYNDKTEALTNLAKGVYIVKAVQNNSDIRTYRYISN